MVAGTVFAGGCATGCAPSTSYCLYQARGGACFAAVLGATIRRSAVRGRRLAQDPMADRFFLHHVGQRIALCRFTVAALRRDSWASNRPCLGCFAYLRLPSMNWRLGMAMDLPRTTIPTPSTSDTPLTFTTVRRATVHERGWREEWMTSSCVFCFYQSPVTAMSY